MSERWSTVQAVSMLMWSHAQLRRQPYAVLTSAVIKHAEECTGAYSMQGSTNLVWALHTLMPTVPAIPRATTQRMASTLTSHGANVLRLVVRSSPWQSCLHFNGPLVEHVAAAPVKDLACRVPV